MKKLIFAILFSSQFAMAAIGKEATVHGVITKFDAKTVTLSQRGKPVKVPRAAIPKHFKIRPGNEVFAVIDTKAMKAKFKK